jgi:hypothetical protein
MCELNELDGHEGRNNRLMIRPHQLPGILRPAAGCRQCRCGRCRQIALVRHCRRHRRNARHCPCRIDASLLSRLHGLDNHPVHGLRRRSGSDRIAFAHNDPPARSACAVAVVTLDIEPRQNFTIKALCIACRRRGFAVNNHNHLPGNLPPSIDKNYRFHEPYLFPLLQCGVYIALRKPSAFPETTARNFNVCHQYHDQTIQGPGLQAG